MSALEDNAVKAIRQAHVTLREAIATILSSQGTAMDSMECATAAAVLAAVRPILSALTGTDESTLNRQVISHLLKEEKVDLFCR